MCATTTNKHRKMYHSAVVRCGEAPNKSSFLFVEEQVEDLCLCGKALETIPR